MEESNNDLNFASAIEEAKYWREKVRINTIRILVLILKS